MADVEIARSGVCDRGRIDPDLLARVDAFIDRCLNAAEQLESRTMLRRVVDQLVGCSTSFGANLAEADEAMSRRDFCRHLAIAAKELSEARYWLRLCGRRGWINADRLTGLTDEAGQLKRIIGAMLTRTRSKGLKEPS